jgi:sec-independent protein translocase protein TatA
MSLGGGHIWMVFVLLAIVLIIWGPGKLPEMGAGMGRAIREFRKATTETSEHVQQALSTPPAADADPAVHSETAVH